jgi:hypothetical protein
MGTMIASPIPHLIIRAIEVGWIPLGLGIVLLLGWVAYEKHEHP